MPDHFIACCPPDAGLLPGPEPGAGIVPAVWHGHGRFTPRARRTAFTLVEMLVVLAIVAVLVALVAPAITSILRGLQISQNGQLIESQLDLARQAALSNSRSVEVRLCQVNGKFSAVLPLLITNTINTVNANQPVYQTIGKPAFISDSVLIDSGATLSTLVSPNGATAAAPVANYSNPSLGTFGQNYKYVSFRFKPDGTTDLNQSSLWFLTVHSAIDADPAPNPPKNFYTIQVDAYNGHVSQFRP